MVENQHSGSLCSDHYGNRNESYKASESAITEILLNPDCFFGSPGMKLHPILQPLSSVSSPMLLVLNLAYVDFQGAQIPHLSSNESVYLGGQWGNLPPMASFSS